MKLILILSILLGGCVTATMVSAPGDASSEFAPVNEKSRGGVVKYLNQGADFVIKGRREDAYKQMHTACRGKYRIDAEGQKSEGGMVQPIGAGAMMQTDIQHWYIQFSCVE